MLHTANKLPIISPKTTLDPALDKHAEEAWYLHNVGTAPSVLGTGIGKRMVQVLHDALDEAVGGRVTVFLHTTGAVSECATHPDDMAYKAAVSSDQRGAGADNTGAGI